MDFKKLFLSILERFFNSPYKTRAVLAASVFIMQILDKMGFDTAMTPDMQNHIVEVIDDFALLLFLIPMGGKKEPVA